MNWKSTIALVLLAGAAGAWFFMGDAWKPQLGLRPAHTEPTLSATVKAVDSLTPQDITSIKVSDASGDPLEVRRENADAPWTMPGNWPPRIPEVRELVRVLGTLRTRFQPVAAGETPDLAKYGLAPEQKPIAVVVGYKKPDTTGKLAEGTLDLLFGEPPLPEGETTFTRPTYVRISTKDTDGKTQSEIVKLGPDAMPIIRRTADSYRRRQLFPDIERVKLAGATPPPNPLAPPPPADAPSTVSLPGLQTDSIAVTQPRPTVLGFDLTPLSSFTLKRVGKLPEPGLLAKGGEPTLRTDRLADAWQLVSPVEDHAEPERLRAVLTAVADLWVEEFVHPLPDEAKLGFSSESRTVTVKGQGGEPVTVRFGGVAKTTEREEMITIPGGQPGAPPRTIPRKISTEYLYARVDGNPQVFVVSGEKLGDIFVSAASITDPRVARFDANEVQQVIISRGGQQPITLSRKKATPKAANPDERADRWVIATTPNDLLADSRTVTDLLDQLTQFRADTTDRRTYPANALPTRTTVTVLARENRADGEPDAPERKYELRLGTNPSEPSLLAVFLPERPRVTLVDDRIGPDDPGSWIGSRLFPETLSSLIERPAITYRSRKLFDTAGTSVAEVEVPAGFTLKRQDADWKLTAPIASEADPTKATQLAQTLAGLQATDYLAESPTAEQLATFGLEKPAHSVRIKLDNGRSYSLEIGSPRPGKPEVFARLDGGAVFGLAATVNEPFVTGAIGLLPLKVWTTSPDKLTSVEITRFGDAAKQSFTLTKDNADWRLTGPFTAPVTATGAQTLLTTLGSLTAEKYQSLASANAAEFGFDKPLLSVKVNYLERKPNATEDTPAMNLVTVGGVTPDGANRYAKLDTPNAPVFVVPAAFVAAAQTAPLELPDRSLLSLDPTKVTGVRVAAAKADDTFAITKVAGGKWAAEGATFGVDPGRITELNAIATRPPITRLAAYGDAIKWADYGLEKPDTTITVTTAGDKPATHTVALGNPDPSGARFARIDDKPAVAVLPSQAAEVLTRKRFDYADRTLLKFDPTTLVTIARTKNKEELELAPGAAVGWDIIKPAKQKADAVVVDELADALGRLRAERVAAYGKKDDVFKQYGLEPATAVVTLTVGEKAEQKTLRIGNPVDAAKPEGDRYVAVDSPAAEIIVGVLPAGIVNKLLAPLLAFRDRTLANFVDIDKAVFERGDRKITFAKSGAMWKVTEPLTADAESAALAELLVDLGGLRADVWVGEKGKDSKEFGLEKPEAKWTLFNGDKTVLALQIGKKAADGRVAAAVDGKDLIGSLTPAMSTRVLAEYRTRRVWTVDAAQTERVDVSLGSSKFTLEKAGMQWGDPAKPTDMLDVRYVNELVGTLGALRAERYAADKDADPKLFGLEKPEAIVTATSPNQKATLEIGGVVGGTDGKQRYARVAGKTSGEVFVLSAADTERLTRDRALFTLKK